MKKGRQGKQRATLPPAQPGSFGGAILNSYMCGFWMGVFCLLSQWLNADLAYGGHGYLLKAMGTQSLGWTKFWLFVLFLVTISPTSVTAREYFRLTGRTFLEDRIGFAKAGGQDIGTFAGISSTLVFVALFITTVPAWVPSFVRLPLLIALPMVFGRVLARVLARRAFSVLFGNISKRWP